MSCVVCGENLKENRVLTICKKRECKKRLESLIISDYVVAWLRDRTELAHLHLTIGYKAFQSSRWKLIAHPYPVYFDNHSDLLKAVIPLKELFCEAHDNDSQLAKRISEPSYVLVKFILMTAPPLEVMDSPVGCKMFAVPGDHDSNVVFHGSSEDNWYSIIRNGLKPCSGTVWQSNGAAFGNGIYLGETLSISAGYARGDQIIGVYKWIKKPSLVKSGGIYVVPNNTCIKLQYLIVSKQLTVEVQKEIMDLLK